MTEIEIVDAKAASARVELGIAAAADVVWRALTDGVDDWWPADFRMLGEGARVSLEARAGGQLLEAVEGGASLEWYAVQMCVPGSSLDLVGDLSADFGGPATTHLRLGLEPDGDGTRLAIRYSVVGRVEEEGLAKTAGGWLQLFESLKQSVEGRA